MLERNKLKLVRSVDLGSSLSGDLLGSLVQSEEAVRLEPGESFQCVYLLKSDSSNFESADGMDDAFT